MIWFVEIRSPLGKWIPHLFHGDCPERVTVDGKRTFRHDPVAVIPRLARYPVQAFAEVVSPSGKLHGDVTQDQFADFLEHPTKHLMVIRA